MTALRNSLLLIFLAAPVGADAQRVRSAAIGDRIRVVAPLTGHDVLTGRVESAYPDLIGMKVDGSVGLFYVRRNQIEEIFLSAARHRRVGPGAGLGVVIGSFAAVMFGGKGTPSGPLDKKPATPVLQRMLIGGAVGGLLGAGIGYLSRSDEWVEISAAPSVPPGC